MRASFLTLLLAAIIAIPASAAGRSLDRPVRYPGQAARVPAPAYAGDVVAIRLAPAAAREAWPAYRARVPANRLGLAALDRAAADLGGARFEPLFHGERLPDPGSNAHDFTAYYLVRLPPGVALERALERFESVPEVAKVEPLTILPLDAVPNDSLWAASYWYSQPSRRDMHAPEAWDVTTGDTSIVVGILDTGVVPYHPDLGGTVAGLPGQIYTNWVEADGVPGVDDDGNGFVDDVHGWDFVNLASPNEALAGEDWQDEDNDPNDMVAHGTGVAGLVGALTNNAIGIAGVNWNVRLMPLRIGFAFPGSSLGSGEVRMDFIVKAIRYATRMGVHVVNGSFANLNEVGLDAALDEAAAAGMTVVVSAGNNGQVNYMATRHDVISVASTGAGDALSAFSNRGAHVDLAAPGEGIASTWLAPRPVTGDSLAFRQGSYRSTLSGTSFSAPLVAGAAALLQARQRQLGQAPLDPMSVLLRLYDTADDIRAQNPGLDGQYGGGRLNLDRALAESWRSRAVNVGGKVVGATAVLTVDGGGTRVIAVCDDRRLLMLDGATLATVWAATLPFPPFAGPAVGLLPGQGIGIFTGLGSGRVAGHRHDGTPLPGWPVFIGVSSTIRSGVALGDLDGDGSPEVLAGADNGGLWAWHADGSMVSGFPVDVSPGFRTLPVAVTGTVPARVAAAAEDGTVVLLDDAGNVLAGWPVILGGTPSAPVFVTIRGAPAVVLAEGTNLHALGFDGLERPGFPVALGSALPSRAEVAIGDVDQNGVADLVVGGLSPPRLDVRDSTGASLASLGWPRVLTSGVTGSPVLGHLTGGGAPEAMALLGTGLAGFANDAGSLFGFPKPGGGGTFPTLADLDGDGTTEVLAGSTLDSLLFVYDAGTASAAAEPQAWPTFRGDVQRTGSALSREAAPVVDPSAPGGVNDLTVTALGVGGARLRWTAPGDDGSSGTPYAMDVRRSPAPIDAGNFSSATALVAGPPAAGGSLDSLDASGLQEGITYYFALRAVDEVGNQGPISNVASLVLNVVSPAAVTDVRALSATDTSVVLAWTATGEDGQVGRPDLYVVRASTAPITDANFLQAPYVRTVPATVDAGGTESLDFRFLDPATRYWFALKAFDSAGSGSPLSNVVVAQTKVGGPLDFRDGIALAPGSNPSRVPARLFWQSAPEALGQRQEIKIHDLMGRLVRTLDLGQEIGGVAQWDGRDDDGHRVAAGLYLVRLASGPRSTHTRLVLLP